MSKIERLARTSPSEIILVVSSTDTLLVVSTLDILDNLRLPSAAVLSVLKELIIVPMENMGPFLLKDNPFKTVKGLVDYAEDRELGVRASPSELILVLSSSDTLLVVSTLVIV